MATMTYEVEVERDEGGAWIARVPAVPGCHTYGRSIRQAQNRIREALALWVEDAETAELHFRHRLPARALKELTRVRIARQRASVVQREAKAVTSRAIKYLSNHEGLSVRDIAGLIGLSHQRVQQLLEIPADTARSPEESARRLGPA
jgi:predicted RNase H-like HicB family nuclease